ncbi:uncharacterized protein BDW43DRAFT_302512 [Aspergillus alliaceus]|uniref:uncharacterized protein n=1 Tax=Petromyces alliaceus TaxID=209559 RepID=UPI0012A41320|nr:uncharacterized protein BDW43DRAFT_302512 [Aspergillus alliaceus]KAB8230426.1 hypothetical protein BDW43DRAFT_302512 [Aspergillus alliaceus]
MVTSPKSIQSTPATLLKDIIILQPPRSRCGCGPGLALVRPSSLTPCEGYNTSLDPTPMQKWVEESYAVVQITIDEETASEMLPVLVRTGVVTLAYLSECDNKGKFNLLAGGTRERGASSDSQKFYSYPVAVSATFIVPGHDVFRSSEATIAHLRSLTFLKKCLDGPYFDLEAIWEEHTSFESDDHPEPYVNGVPTVIIGRANLTNFYLKHFIFSNPDNSAMELQSYSRINRVVDELIFCFTHNKGIDWLISGVPPIGRSRRILFTAVVNIRGDRLYREHIAGDQATVLVQLGLLLEYLPFPYALPDGHLPVPGNDSNTDEHLVPSNWMI